MRAKIEVKVNFEKNTVTIIKTVTHALFNMYGIYGIEGDSGGYSRIEKRGNYYYQKNYLKKGNTIECLSSVPMNQTQVRNLIKEIELERCQPQ